METFKVVAKIKYKENSFYVLINKFCQKYFIKEFADGSIMYPTVEEYKELNELFDKKQALSTLRIFKDYNIEPKLITKRGKLIALTLLITALGVTLSRETISPEPEIPIVTDNTESNHRLEEIYRKFGYDFHSLTGYENQRLYRIHQYTVDSKEQRVTECQDFAEFGRYIDTKINPTYDELRETLNSNPNVDEKYRQWLLEGIDSLEKTIPNANLTVLNFNLNRLQLEETTLEKVNEGGHDDILAGRFDPETGKAVFIDLGNDESNKFLLFHEVLGHGMTEASFEIETDETLKYGENSSIETHISSEKIVISDSIFIMKCLDEENEFGRDYDFFYVGQGVEEGKADTIATLAMGDTMKITGTPYIEAAEQLRIMCAAVGLDFSEYLSSGGAEKLNEKLQENDVENSLAYLYAVDIYVSAMKTNQVQLIDKQDTFKENILAFFKDYADNKINNGKSRESIVAEFSKILEDGGEYIHSTFSGEEIYYSDFEKEVEDTVQMIGKEEDNQERDN